MIEKTIKNNVSRSNVGCFLNSTIKTALNIEVSQLKYEFDSNYSINEHIENIFIAFLNKYEDAGGNELQKMILKTHLSKDDFNDKKMMLKRINTSNKPFPLSLPLDLSKRLDNFKNKINKLLGWKLAKQYLHNLILLIYFIENKNKIIKKEIDFWSKDSFKKGPKDISLNKIIESKEIQDLLNDKNNVSLELDELKEITFNYFSDIHKT